jgi:glycogen(starch) synthase
VAPLRIASSSGVVTLPRQFLIATEAAGFGLGRFAVELANALEAAGASVTMAARLQPYRLHISRHLIIMPPTAQRGWRKLIQLARQSLAIAAAVLRHAGPGQPLLLIHIAPTLPVSLAPIFAAKLRRAPIALSLHDFYPHTPRFPPGLQRLERWLYRMAYRRCDLLLTNTAAQSRRLIAEAGLPANRVRTLFHGPFVLTGLAPPKAANGLLLLVFGSLRPNKRVREAIQAVRLLRAEGLAVSLRIAGAPRREDAAYWALCRQDIPADDPGFDVQASFVADDQLARIFSGVDAMLCPYAGFDSQSGVAVTAVSNAIPVIGTAAARAPHVDLSSALAATCGQGADATAIAEALRGFLGVPQSDRLAFAAEMQARFLAAGSWDRLAADYMAAMHERDLWAACR